MPIDLERLKAAVEDRYALDHELGEGGMATVFLAQDLKHNRKVALKVLKPELAAVVGGERFLTEIETTANLQHPHILPLFDSGEADGFLYYVMPYVEGESLRDLLEREHQLGVEESVEIIRKVASALQYAHENDVVHRDVKPANILMSRGEPLVADFGIALALSEAGGGRITETGLSLGTPHYMSPEQAAGERNLDVRSDVYALGCILYEMLTGEPPHGGPTPQSVLAKILTDRPRRITELRRTVPVHVDAAVAKALEKLPADRFHSAGEFARALQDPAFTHATMEPGRPRRAAEDAGSARPWQIATGVLGLATVGLAAAFLTGGDAGGEDGAREGVTRFSLSLPVARGAAAEFGPNLAVSPDGRAIVYSGMTEESSAPGLWIRRWDRIEPEPLPGTEAGVHPTFSPDGDQVAFVTDNREIKVVSLTGRPPVTLIQDAGIRRAGLSWGRDGYIYFSYLIEDGTGPIHRIPAAGGEIEQITVVDTTKGEVRHYFPDRIDGTPYLVYAAARDQQYAAETRQLGIADVETGEIRDVLQGVQGAWSPTGHLLSIRADGTLLAATFDPTTLEVGPARPVFEGVQLESQASADFAVSETGTLVFVAGDVLGVQAREAVWVDRSGVARPVDPSWRGAYSDPRISPDGRRVAVEMLDESGERHIWIKQLDEGPVSKLTFEGRNTRPVWSPDGVHVVFVSTQGTNEDLYRRRADGATPAMLVLDREGVIQQVEYSPDGRWMVFREGEDIYVVGTEEGAEPEPLLADPGAAETNFALSPDGRWIAYASTESGDSRVYVRPFPNVEDGKWPVSRGVAISPRWSPDGTELFFKSADGGFKGARITTGPNTLVVGDVMELFSHRTMMSDTRHAQYDVHPDGERFLMIEVGDDAQVKPVLVVENFTAELADGGRE